MLSGYLLCIIGTTLVSSILLAILPEGKSSSMVKGMAKLVCIVSIVSPIPKLIGQTKRAKNTVERRIPITRK